MDSKTMLLAIGWLFLGTVILGAVVFISLTFQLELFGWDYRSKYWGAESIFNYESDGGASTAPIFLGLLSMTGAFLVSKYTKD